MKKIIVTSALLLSSMAFADGEGRPDIQIIASNSSSAPATPNCYKRVGYWDADRGGAVGTATGTRGSYMTGLYILNRKSTSRYCDFSKATDIEDIKLVASNRSSADPSWQYYHRLAGYYLIGYWDIDGGGGQGDLGSSGSYMMFMYAKPYKPGISVTKITDLQYRASNERYAPYAPGNNYERLGFWDVDDGGAVGTNGSRGEYMSAIFAKYDYNP